MKIALTGLLAAAANILGGCSGSTGPVTQPDFPAVTVRELTHGGHQLAPHYERQKYSCKMHGVGLCDEWPLVPYPDAWVEGAFEVALEPGMVLCVEALVSPEGGDFSIKLEDQVLITETGCETLTTYPFDERLMG